MKILRASVLTLAGIFIVKAESAWINGECYNDHSRLLERHLTSSSDMTPELCIGKCADSAYSFAGVQYHKECWCGDEQPPQEEQRPQSECNSACTGDKSIMCGGGWRMNIFSTGPKQDDLFIQEMKKVIQGKIPQERNYKIANALNKYTSKTKISQTTL